MADLLKEIFTEARTHSVWQEKPVEDALLAKVYDLAKMGPTATNMNPLRVVFVKSKAAKERLKPCLDAGNVEKTMSAPVTALFAHDMAYYEHINRLFPHAKDPRSWFSGLPEEKHQVIALRNGSLQAAYFILAARALGLDCGPMSGFNNAKLDAEFFAGTTFKSNFICNLGYGVKEKLHPRGPRFEFSEVCKIV